MIILKIFVFVLFIFMFLWTIWAILIHFNLLEGEQAYSTPFPFIRLLILLALIYIFML
jgi:uncharacterized membrane protein YdbT with pleckstrin-like domain